MTGIGDIYDCIEDLFRNKMTSYQNTILAQKRLRRLQERYRRFYSIVHLPCSTTE